MTMTSLVMVGDLWVPPTQFTADEHLKVYQTCERGKGTRCINTNNAKASAKVLGRSVRKVNTLDGYQNWSECVDGQWHMFRQMLKLPYAKKVDAFDQGVHFKLPTKCPLKQVEYLGPCIERNDPLEIIRARKALYHDRVKKGLVVPRAKFRRPQAAAVLAMSA